MGGRDRIRFSMASRWQRYWCWVSPCGICGGENRLLLLHCYVVVSSGRWTVGILHTALAWDTWSILWAYYIPRWRETRDLYCGHITYRAGMRYVIYTVGILHTALAWDTWSIQWAYYIPRWRETRHLDSGHITYRTGMRHVICTVGILHTALPWDTWSIQWAYYIPRWHETRDLDSGHIT